MSENRSLNSLFARLDESKANRANEANREHEKAAEEAEKERQKKKGEYFYSKRLIHGINLFQSLNYKYNPEGFDF